MPIRRVTRITQARHRTIASYRLKHLATLTLTSPRRVTRRTLFTTHRRRHVPKLPAKKGHYDVCITNGRLIHG